MNLLGQQEIFAKPARRRLVVPAGHVAHWGVDPSSVRVALATVAADGLRGYEIRSFPSLPAPQRQSIIYGETRAMAKLVADVVPPGLIWIEQPSGPIRNLELVYAVGSIMAGIYDGVLEATGLPPAMEMIVSTSWKLISCGSGRISKPKRERGKPAPAPEEYGVLRWAWENGLSRSETSWDVCDAWAIAEAARRDVVLDAR